MTEETIIPSDKILCACGTCDEWIPGINKKGLPATFKHGHNRKGKPAHPNSIHRGATNWAWKGGRRINTQGYVMIYMPGHPRADKNNCVREHILVMEKYLGRPLEPGEEVHHINGIRTDNRIENLKLMKNHAEHMTNHKKDMSNRVCAYCHGTESYDRRWNLTTHGTGFVCGRCYAYRRYHGLSI